MSFRAQLLLAVIDKLIIGLFLLLAGLWVNRELESYRLSESRRSADVVAKVHIVDRQLSELYWPVIFRLEKDNAVWTRLLDSDKRLVGEIERAVILPNHTEILKLVDSKADLIFNVWEPVQPAIIDAIKAYERHVAVYQSLRTAGSVKMPMEVGEIWPSELYPMLNKRVKELLDQRAKYGKE